MDNGNIPPVFLKKPSDRLMFNIVRREFRPWTAILVTLIVMGLLIALVYFCQIPNPNMILIAGLVICSALFGFSGGITAAVIMLGYSLYFFSAGHDFVTFNDQNFAKLMVSVFGIVVDMVFVCILKRLQVKALRGIEDLSEQLRIENESLYQASATDALTGIGNRLSLRLKFDRYLHCDLCVIMMDIDDFKSINDRFGHDVGDEALVMTAKMLSEIFGAESCYRYGGDEFLVLLRDPFADECLKKIFSITENRPILSAGDDEVTVNYSIGYRLSQIRKAEDFRRLMTIADANMYAAKRGGKNRVVGTLGNELINE